MRRGEARRRARLGEAKRGETRWVQESDKRKISWIKEKACRGRVRIPPPPPPIRQGYKFTPAENLTSLNLLQCTTKPCRLEAAERDTITVREMYCYVTWGL